MKYKALMMDIDGTLAPISFDNNRSNMPSLKIQTVIQEAKKHLLVGVITGRPSYAIKHVLKKLQLNCYCITINGAEIINPKNLNPLWRRPIKTQLIPKILSLAEKYNFSILASDFSHDIVLKAQDKITTELADIYFENVSLTTLPIIEQELSSIPGIIYHRIPVEDKKYIGIDITDKDVSKQHALIHLTKTARIKTEEIIGVGDSYNDFPMLMACGLRVAMGNAVPELKAIADFVAPSVDEDGVATVIEKFILS